MTTGSLLLYAYLLVGFSLFLIDTVRGLYGWEGWKGRESLAIKLSAVMLVIPATFLLTTFFWVLEPFIVRIIKRCDRLKKAEKALTEDE